MEFPQTALHQDLTQIYGFKLGAVEIRGIRIEDTGSMNSSTILRTGLFGIACVAVFASSIALAEPAQDATSGPAATAQSQPPSDGAQKRKSQQPDKKSQSGSEPAKAADADKTPKPGHYATEGEARARCRGTVVWVDKDNFNHYAGSREYGRKPGAFACEKG